MTGTIRVTGSTPQEQVMIVPDQAGMAAVEVRGEWRSELIRLEGARVEVGGTPAAPGHFEAQRYKILEIAGYEPVVGILESAADRLTVRTPAGDAVAVGEAPADLRAQVGAKVWVILDENGAVQGYGVLREP
ncbi:MAG: hypothetical protein JSU87_09680 [Gemmatimonadota bacterium]|nr:MAG: hypothetical protein JSU87_09680 [Gemmatimonadota bacterium]